MSRPDPVMLIGMDAADIDLVERLCEAGRMPALAGLRARGCRGELGSSPSGFLSMVWSTFYNGRTVPWHGWYFNKLWNPAAMRLQYATPEWLPQSPFWDRFGQGGPRVVLLDVPYSPPPEPDLAGTYVSGWQTHDEFERISFPEGTWKELEGEFGPPSWPREMFGPQSARTLLRLREEMLEAADQYGRLARALAEREPWDLYLAVLGAAHRAGHYLWDLSQIDVERLSDPERHTLEGGLADVYEACDRTLAELLEAAPEDARIVVFALHGMQANTGWSERFGEIVGHLHASMSGRAPARGLLYRIKRVLPWRLVRQVTTRLPRRLNQALVPLWSSRMLDWSSTRFFALPVDVNGFLRINLRGREAQGIVEPGREYRELCEELREAFLGLRVIETGEPIAERVRFLDDFAPPDAPCRHVLPDLVVEWRDSVGARGTSGIRSDRHGEIRWDPDWRFPSGRSGNHHGRGWLVAAAPGLPEGRKIGRRDILDVAPTVLRWLGEPVPDELEGRPIPELAGELPVRA